MFCAKTFVVQEINESIIVSQVKSRTCLPEGWFPGPMGREIARPFSPLRSCGAVEGVRLNMEWDWRGRADLKPDMV